MGIYFCRDFHYFINGIFPKSIIYVDQIHSSSRLGNRPQIFYALVENRSKSNVSKWS